VAHICSLSELIPKIYIWIQTTNNTGLGCGSNTSHYSFNMPLTTFYASNRTNIHLTRLVAKYGQVFRQSGSQTDLWSVGVLLGTLWCGHFLIWFRFLLSQAFYLLFNLLTLVLNAKCKEHFMFCMPNANTGGNWYRLRHTWPNNVINK